MNKHDGFSHCGIEPAVTAEHARLLMQFAEREVCVRSKHAHTVFGLADELLMYHMIAKIPGD